MQATTPQVAEPPAARRSDRVSLELPIQVIGSDLHGRDFVDECRTILVSRHGAKILLGRDLVAEQEITVACPGTGKEATARVVGQLGEEDGLYAYGIAFLDPEVNLWDIEFPPLAESERAVGRVLLECLSCHSREVTYLNDFEAETLEITRRLSRSCKRCGTGLWKLLGEPPSGPQGPEVAPAAPEKPATPSPAQGPGLRLKACLKHPQLGDEVLTTESASRAGIVFKSSKHYEFNLPLQVAVPYLPGAANIFAPVQIERAEFLSAERVTLYTVTYIPVHRGWPQK